MIGNIIIKRVTVIVKTINSMNIIDITIIVVIYAIIC